MKTKTFNEREFKKVLLANGFKLKSQESSHQKFIRVINGHIEMAIVSTHPNRYTYERVIKDFKLVI